MFGFGGKTGKDIKYYDNGQKEIEINLVKSIEGAWLDDETQMGTWTTWHENGNKSGHLEFDIFGHQVGESVSWHENGQMKAQCAINDDGVSEGLYTEWHSNGQKSEEGYLVSGLKDGKFTRWDKSGEVVAIDEYINGDLV